MKNITTVILAAGKSSRFKNNTSKIFQDLGGLSIIEHVYQLAKKISTAQKLTQATINREKGVTKINIPRRKYKWFLK